MSSNTDKPLSYLGYLISLGTLGWAFWLVFQNELESHAVIIAVILYMVLRALTVELFWWLGKDDETAWVRRISRTLPYPEDWQPIKDLETRSFAFTAWGAGLGCGLMAFVFSRGTGLKLRGDEPGRLTFEHFGTEVKWGFLIACAYLASRLIHRLPMAWNRGIGVSQAANSLPAVVLMCVMVALFFLLWVGLAFNWTVSHWWVSGLTLFFLTLFDEDLLAADPKGSLKRD